MHSDRQVAYDMDAKALGIQLKESEYKCKHCGVIVIRQTSKKWIKSYCQKTGKNVHLMRINNQ